MTTQKELEEKLKALGIDPKDPTWIRTKSVDLGKLPLVQDQRASLAKVAELLEQQVSSDLAQVHALREQLARAKRGGGR